MYQSGGYSLVTNNPSHFKQQISARGSALGDPHSRTGTQADGQTHSRAGSSSLVSLLGRHTAPSAHISLIATSTCLPKLKGAGKGQPTPVGGRELELFGGWC